MTAHTTGIHRVETRGPRGGKHVHYELIRNNRAVGSYRTLAEALDNGMGVRCKRVYRQGRIVAVGA